MQAGFENRAASSTCRASSSRIRGGAFSISSKSSVPAHFDKHHPPTDPCPTSRTEYGKKI
jgi:hypothetical protein